MKVYWRPLISEETRFDKAQRMLQNNGILSLVL